MKCRYCEKKLATQADYDALTRRAYRIIERWLEWARMHGHLEHAEGIVKDSRDLIAYAPLQGLERSNNNLQAEVRQ